eukprot:9283262-Pyramimonas_sp.AAC.1
MPSPPQVVDDGRVALSTDQVANRYQQSAGDLLGGLGNHSDLLASDLAALPPQEEEEPEGRAPPAAPPKADDGG